MSGLKSVIGQAPGDGMYIAFAKKIPASISLGVSWLSYFSDIFGGGTFAD